MNRLNAAYEATQREQQIALLNKEKELQRAQLQRQRVILAAGVLLFGALVLTYVLQRRSERRYRVLRGLLPICASCKKIRDDRGAWQPMEHYISARSDADFTHGYCPTCSEKALAEL